MRVFFNKYEIAMRLLDKKIMLVCTGRILREGDT